MNAKYLKPLVYPVMAIVLLAVFFMPLDYYIFLPGKALELSEMISLSADGDDDLGNRLIEEGRADSSEAADEDEGAFMMTVVLSQQANPILYLRGLMDPSIDIYPLEQVRPAETSNEEYHQQMLGLMDNSQMIATGVALREMGFDVAEHGGGILVLNVADYSYAWDVLFPGDILIGIDDQPIELMTELSAILEGKKPGETVDVRIQREDDILEMDIELTPKEADPQAGGIGISCTTYNWNLDLPLKVVVASEDIGGPSAGLMMTLEIMNQLDSEDLTQGYRIAGTGTINWNGEVGAIGGVRQKVMGAIENKADYFFSPKDNAEVARQEAGNKLTVIEVAHLDDALAFIRSLE